MNLRKKALAPDATGLKFPLPIFPIPECVPFIHAVLTITDGTTALSLRGDA